MALVRDPEQEDIYREHFARGRDSVRNVFDECRLVHERWASENRIREDPAPTTAPSAAPLITSEFRP